MSKLVLEFQVPRDYDKASFTDIIRAICGQVNSLSEGRISARYQAQSNSPTTGSSVSYAIGDIIWDSNTTARGSVAAGLAAAYVRVGWVCTVPGVGTGATFKEMRIPTGE